MCGSYERAYFPLLLLGLMENSMHTRTTKAGMHERVAREFMHAHLVGNLLPKSNVYILPCSNYLMVTRRNLNETEIAIGSRRRSVI